MNLAAVDLNLLVYLDALLAECHVTRAGKRVGLSQSAMSRALSRLRDLFEDELLIKTPHGMSPTPLAQDLGPRVRQTLRQIERTIDQQASFDPGLDERTLRVAIASSCATLLAAPLITHLRTEAPGLGVELRPHPGELPSGALERGELDLVVYTTQNMPHGLLSAQLWRDRFETVVGEVPEGRLDPRGWADLDHIVVRAPGEASDGAEAILAQLGLRRRVLATMPDMMSALRTREKSELVVTLPSMLIKELSPTAHTLAPPLTLPPVLGVMAWHPSAETDPAHQWLREALIQISQNL